MSHEPNNGNHDGSRHEGPSIPATMLAVLSALTFLFAGGHVASNWGEWGGFQWLNPASWVFIYVACILACVFVLILVVFFGRRVRMRGLKYRAAGVWTITLIFAGLYASAPGWYKDAGDGWVITELTPKETGIAYVQRILFDPDLRMSSLIFTAIATALGIAALFLTKTPQKSKEPKTNVRIEIPDAE